MPPGVFSFEYAQNRGINGKSGHAAKNEIRMILHYFERKEEMLSV